jgi:hypothetical protein
VFGYFDQKIILEMCKYMETKTIYANNYLFKIGDADDSIYVVESGRVNVYITDEVNFVLYFYIITLLWLLLSKIKDKYELNAHACERVSEND